MPLITLSSGALDRGRRVDHLVRPPRSFGDEVRAALGQLLSFVALDADAASRAQLDLAGDKPREKKVAGLA
jgi:hypothetical protein